MRLALTGGDRILDTEDETILQRAYLPSGEAQVTEVTLNDGTSAGKKKLKEKKNWEGKELPIDRGPGCFFNKAQFPGKRLTLTQAEGAVPEKMLEQARVQGAAPHRQLGQEPAIHIANMGNRIYFGIFEGKAEDCSDTPQKYTIGTASDAPTIVDVSGYRRNLSELIDVGTVGAPSYKPASLNATGATPINPPHTSGDNIFTYYCPEGRGGCYPGDGKQYIVWYGSADGGWATAIVGPGDSNKGAFYCSNRSNTEKDGYSPEVYNKGGYRFSSSNPTTFPTPADKISNRGCWLTEIKTGVKGDSKYTLNGKGYFLGRVKVCDQNDVRDYAMCSKYPSGKNKPVGVIQRYSDNLRLAAFGYAIDQTAAHDKDDYQGRFGALLRAPMKYVGPNTYTPTGVKSSSDNPKKEWDTETGVLIKDPDGVIYEEEHEGIRFSGVINFFNRFGRNPEKRGNYKQFDNVAEMYYEALRYMQGLPPSDSATWKIGRIMKDGMPAYTSWEKHDPFGSDLGYKSTEDYTCLNSSILVIGDINTHDPVNSHKGKLRDTMANKDASKNEIDINKWRSVVRSFETKGSESYTDGSSEARTTSNPNEASFPSDVMGGGDICKYGSTSWNCTGETGRNLWSFLPGMAYWAHTHDIRGANWTNGSTDSKGRSKVRPGLRITSYFFDVNESAMSELYTARVGSTNTGGTSGKVWIKAGSKDVLAYTGYWGNQFWLAAKYGGFSTLKTGCNTVENTDGSTTQTCTGAYNMEGNPFYGMSCATTTNVDGSERESSCTTTPNNDVWSVLDKGQGDNNGKDENGNDVPIKPEPRTYYMPSYARGVLKAFDDIFGAQKPPANRSIGGAATTGGLTGTNFQATFEGDYWSGGVKSERFDKVPDGVDENGKPKYRYVVVEFWDAADKLKRMPTDDRKIFMGTRNESEGTASAFPFTIDDTPNDVKSALRVEGDEEDLADARIAWLRGVRDLESDKGGPFRTRNPSSVLGDIINSGVKFVGAPAGQTNLGEGYAAFVEAQAYRTSAIYVGANDGMLHAFLVSSKTLNDDGTVDEDSSRAGNELFAYIPSWMANKLAALTAPEYTHQPYVDASPVIGDAMITPEDDIDADTGVTADDWASVLVGGTGGGGKGVYALNVTDPAAFDESKLLWEFTDKDDPDMGYVLGQSRIVKLLYAKAVEATATTPATPAVYRWFAMVPAGVNNYGENATDRADGNGDANIFLLALDKPADAAWEQGTNYWKIALPRIEALQEHYPTGLLNLEAFTGLGSVTEYVYAGDLHGQLWALMFKDVPVSSLPNDSYDAAISLAGNYVNCNSRNPETDDEHACECTGDKKIAPLFVASYEVVKDGATEILPQPITVAPTILQGEGNGQHFVGFGTGKYFEMGDTNVGRHDRFYTVYSNFNSLTCDIKSLGEGATGDRPNPGVIPDHTYLQEAAIAEVKDGTTFFKTDPFYWGWIKPADPDDEGYRSGWFYEFDGIGEREVSDASWIPQTSRLMFGTLTPKSANNTGVCGTGGGTSQLYTFDMVSGKGLRKASTVGLLSQPLVFFDTPEETKADSTGRRLRISPVFSGQFGSEGTGTEKVDTVIVPFGRLSWRRIDNFQQLKSSAASAAIPASSP